jgi:hypothetical protein
MEKINFTVSINAPREDVWRVLWDDSSYREWTKAFSEGSYAETDNWKEGSQVRFLDGNGAGMVSMVAINRPNEYMSFKHMGMLKDGVEDTESEEVKKWAGSMENYTLDENNGTTTLKVEMDIAPEYKEYFEKTWPRALERVKILTEQDH